MPIRPASLLILLAVASPGWGSDAEVVSAVAEADRPVAVGGAHEGSVESPVESAGLSAEELQQRIDQWSSLTVDERRELLTEINRRMRAAGRSPVVGVRGERRFGYRVQQPDGSVVSIERREEFVRYRELDPNRPFGVGFEQRALDPTIQEVGTGPLSAAQDQRPMAGPTDSDPASGQQDPSVRPVRQTTP